MLVFTRFTLMKRVCSLLSRSQCHSSGRVMPKAWQSLATVMALARYPYINNTITTPQIIKRVLPTA